jgi:6,7-dimethyl-8-ribityllumazine synthase
VSDRYETPRWDEEEVPVLGEGDGGRESDASDDAHEAEPSDDDAPAAPDLEDPWQRAARETRESDAAGDAIDADRDDAGDVGGDADALDRSSENVLAEWPSAAAAGESLARETRQEPESLPEDRHAAPSGWTAAPAPFEPEADVEPSPQSEPEAEGTGTLVEPGEMEPDAPAPSEPEPAPEPAAAAARDEHAAGSLVLPPGIPALEGVPRGERRAVGIVVSRFNGDVTTRLLDGALAELADRGVATEVITVMPVPGAFELPLAAMALAKTRRFSCIVALGCVIRGDTPHFDYVCSEAASGLQLAAIETGVPVSFGVLTLDRPEQADARVGKGAEAVRTALEMADIFANLRAAAAR